MFECTSAMVSRWGHADRIEGNTQYNTIQVCAPMSGRISSRWPFTSLPAYVHGAMHHMHTSYVNHADLQAMQDCLPASNGLTISLKGGTPRHARFGSTPCLLQIVRLVHVRVDLQYLHGNANGKSHVKRGSSSDCRCGC